MKKTFISIIIIFILNGCYSIETVPLIDGYIYSSVDSLPVRGALIGKINHQNNSIYVKTETDSTGYFSLPPVRKNVLIFNYNNETYFQFEIFKGLYCTEFINFETDHIQYDGRISIDTIYLKPCPDTQNLYTISNKQAK